MSKIDRYINPTKNSHYVKKEYLKRWSIDKKIILKSDDGTNFINDYLDKVCVQEFMYKVSKLSESELRILRNYYKEGTKDTVFINDIFISDWQKI